MRMNRRGLLKGISGAALAGATATTIGGALGGFGAHAAETGGYKALVCLFLLGGLDNHDTVLPYDQASYDRYAELRKPLLDRYQTQSGGSSRARNRLLPLEPANGERFGGRRFALPEQLSGIHRLFGEGRAAIVGNVGPLIRPVTRAEFEAGTAPLPAHLFSHNDQQSTWMSSAPEGAQYGWGGRFADAVMASGANANDAFTTITSLGNELFLTGESALPYQVSADGASMVNVLDQFGDQRGSAEGEELYQKLRAHFASGPGGRSHLIERDIARAAQYSLETNELFNEAFANTPELSASFPQSELGGQLRAVAQTIAMRDTLLVNRQVFFVALGRFDTHSRQAEDLPGLQSEIDEAVTAFFAALGEIGASSDVTLFTASDFGRTLAINGDGTDHGWGAHHFVIGDAVAGGQILGDIPPADLGHDWDAGGGRLIPTVSVEQYAAPLGRWFGLGDGELATALPGLANFAGAEPAVFA